MVNLLGCLLIGVAAGLFFAFRRGREIGVRTDFENPGTLGWLGLGVTFLLFAVFTSLSGVIWNNLWWVFAVTVFATGLGLFVATVTNRMPQRQETIAKAIIFLPILCSRSSSVFRCR